MTEVVGTCTGITEKPTGWTDLEIAVPDKQYPVRLSTKEEGLIIATRALAGAPGRFSYTERESDKINPNSHKPYMNRYLDHVEPVDTNGSEAVVKYTVAESKHQPVVGGDKDRAISRLACLKAAAEIAPHSPIDLGEGGHPDIALTTMKIAQRFELWVYRDIDDVPFGD